jgi:hypothetical protein
MDLHLEWDDVGTRETHVPLDADAVRAAASGGHDVGVRAGGDVMDDRLARRSAQEVLDDHLQLAAEGDLESDLVRNVADDIVVLTGRGVFHGHPGVRELARQLIEEVPSGAWVYRTQLVAGRMAFLEWTVESGPTRIPDGADSYLVEGGKICAQTIHYTLTDADGRVLIRADGTRPGEGG